MAASALLKPQTICIAKAWGEQWAELQTVGPTHLSGFSWKIEKGRPGPGRAQTEPKISELGGHKAARPIAQIRSLKPGPSQWGRAKAGSLHLLSSGQTWSEPLADPTKGLSEPSGLVVAPAWSR